MAKLRTNHRNRGGARAVGGAAARIVAALVLVIALLGVLYPVARNSIGSPAETPPVELGRDRLFLPTGPSDQVVHHRHYSLGYDEDWEQARWVAYRLGGAPAGKRVRRTDDYRPDPAVATGSAQRADYRRSGYTRGHLVPAGDMSFDAEAMSETFYYSNMSPQLAEYNGAVWRELEENVREWARERIGGVYVVSGPIVEPGARRIGGNGVRVPNAFYKALLDERGRAIAYVIPHARQSAPLDSFAVSVDEVERLTGLDLYAELTDLATAEAEHRFDLTAWPTDPERYRRRVGQWNRQR